MKFTLRVSPGTLNRLRRAAEEAWRLDGVDEPLFEQLVRDIIGDGLVDRMVAAGPAAEVRVVVNHKVHAPILEPDPDS